MFRLLKNLFNRKISRKEIVIPNWSLINYSGVVYNVVELGENLWRVEVTLFLSAPTEELTQQVAFCIPLNVAYSDYISAFKHIHKLGPLFANTIEDVVVIDQDGHEIKKMSLNKTPPKFTTIKNKEKIVHLGNETIN